MKTEDIHIRDPYVLTYNGKYYMYGTRTKRKAGCDVYISTDLKNWTEGKSVLEAEDMNLDVKSFWAPEVHMWNGEFYMFVTPNKIGKYRGVYIFKSDSPDGKFMPYSERITPEEWECLDGTLYTENGNPYMVFCHEWTQVGNGEVCAIELEKDLRKAKGEPFVLWTAKEAQWTVHFGEDPCNYVTDGPFVFSDKNGKLSSLWSSFCKTGYAVAVAYSANGKIKGEWITEDVPLIESDSGHAMIFETFEGKKMLSMHLPNNNPYERPVFVEVDI